MRRRSHRLVALGATLAVSLAAGACSDADESLLTRAPEDGITIGIANERPYGYEEDGRAVGEAPALATAIFSRLGIRKVNFEVVDFDDLITGLNGHRFDVIAAGMTITSERSEEVAFTDPDHCSTTAFAVPSPNPQALRDYSSVVARGSRLGVLADGAEGRDAARSGVPSHLIEPFPTAAELFDALQVGSVEALALTSIGLRNDAAELPGIEVTRGFMPTLDGVEQRSCAAFAFRWEDLAFRNEFNAHLLEMRSNGQILPLVRRYGFRRAEIDAARGVTAAELR